MRSEAHYECSDDNYRLYTAAASGTRIAALHCGQLNSIAMVILFIFYTLRIAALSEIETRRSAAKHPNVSR